MMRQSLYLVAACGLSACATASITDDQDAPAAVVQATDLTCGWLIDGSAPPKRERAEALGWTQIMSRDTVVIPDFMQRFQEGRPALAGFTLSFGERGGVIASYWEDYCYGVLSFERGRSIESLVDNLPGPAAELEPSLVALETWIARVLPDAVPMQPAFKSGEERPFVARANRKLAFLAVIGESGWGLEWRLMPTEKLLALTQPGSTDVETPPE